MGHKYDADGGEEEASLEEEDEDMAKESTEEKEGGEDGGKQWGRKDWWSWQHGGWQNEEEEKPVSERKPVRRVTPLTMAEQREAAAKRNKENLEVAKLAFRLSDDEAMTHLKGEGVWEHDSTDEDGEKKSSYHRIYIAPGSKLAAVVGAGGFVRVNSRHSRGVTEAQKSPRLLAAAYSIDDGMIEALESPDHDWVIGVQFRPELRREIPPQFDRLFQGLVERAGR